MGEHRFALVSEWMENGNINNFIKRDRYINRVELVCCHLLLDHVGALLMPLFSWLMLRTA